MQIIQDNSEIIVFVLVMVVTLLTVVVYNMQKTITDYRDEQNEFVEWFNEVFTHELSENVEKIRIDSRKMFTNVWEYFYIILAVKNVLKVSPDTFLADGLEDLIKKYPEVAEIMQLSKSNSSKQGVVFDNNFHRYNKEEIESIFDKHKPDRPVF